MKKHVVMGIRDVSRKTLLHKGKKMGNLQETCELNEMGSYMSTERWVVICDKISVAWDKKWGSYKR